MPTETYLATSSGPISRYMDSLNQDGSWPTCRNNNANSMGGGCYIAAHRHYPPTYEIYRPQFVIDTSNLDGKNLKDARLYIYPIGKWNTSGVSIRVAYDTDNVYPTDQGCTNFGNFNIANYDSIGSGILALADITINAWNHIHIPKEIINKTGKTRFILLFDNDWNNSVPADNSINLIQLNLSQDDGGGSPNRGPYLEVDWQSGSAPKENIIKNLLMRK